MFEKSLRQSLYGTTARSHPAEHAVGPYCPDDAADDSEAVKRYRRFFQTHDLTGLPHKRPFIDG